MGSGETPSTSSSSSLSVSRVKALLTLGSFLASRSVHCWLWYVERGEADYSRAIVSASSSYARVLPGRPLAVLAALGLAALTALALALAVGSVALGTAALFRALTGGDGTES